MHNRCMKTCDVCQEMPVHPCMYLSVFIFILIFFQKNIIWANNFLQDPHCTRVFFFLVNTVTTFQ